MKINFTLIIFFCFLTIEYCSAQGDNALDAKYTPPSGSIFDATKASELYGNGVKNSVNLDLGLFARGQAVLCYSRAIGSKGLAFSTAIGVPFDRDFIHQNFIDEWTEGANYSPLNLAGFYDITTFRAARPLFQASLKYYFDGNGFLEDNFIEATVRRQSELHDSGNQDFYNVIGGDNLVVSHTTIFLGYGGTYVGEGKTPFVSNLTYGIGLRTTKTPEFLRTYEASQFGNATEHYRLTSGELSFTNFAVYFTYSLGLGW